MTTITLALTPAQAQILHHSLSQELVELKSDATINKFDGADQRHAEGVALFHQVVNQLNGGKS